jgi:hypothetical protein
MLTLLGIIGAIGFAFTVPGRLLVMGILWAISTGVPFLIIIMLLKK